MAGKIFFTCYAIHGKNWQEEALVATANKIKRRIKVGLNV
jgi:hypothetical protein